MAEEIKLNEVFFPKRKTNSNKTDYGKLLIISGSVGMTGCTALCANAAVRSGAGLVYVGVPRDIYTITAVSMTEPMPFPLPCENGQICCLDENLLQKIRIADSCVIGPGLGKNEKTVKLIYDIIKNVKCPTVVDADALYALSINKDIFNSIHTTLILTPHEGEFKRLGGDLSLGRENAAIKLAKELNSIIILKGHGTIIAFPNGKTKICNLGGPGMAKGGSGDVLAGVIGALLGQFDVEKAVTSGVYIHSLAGDFASEKYGEYSMTASDIISFIPNAILKNWSNVQL